MKQQILIQENNFEKARKKIKENSGKEIIFSGDNDELNRKILEKEPIDILLLKQTERKDFSKQRNSGLNQVLAKLAKKSNIAIGIDLEELTNSKKKDKPKIIAGIKQNIKLCNKNKVKMKFIGIQQRNIRDIKALGLVLGMPTWMTKEF